MVIRCAHCGENRRTWSLWRSIVALGGEVVCCWWAGEA